MKLNEKKKNKKAKQKLKFKTSFLSGKKDNFKTCELHFSFGKKVQNQNQKQRKKQNYGRFKIYRDRNK